MAGRAPSSGGPVDHAVLEDFAAASRILADQGVFDAAGHVTMRHPGHPERFLMSRSLAPALVTPSDILELTLDGESCDPQGRAPFIERHLHAGVYRARPDVKAVVHAHPKWSTFLTMTGHGYLPVYAQGSLVWPMPVLDSPNSINNKAMADRLAATLADRPAAMMKSHGAVTVGKTIVEAFVLANYLEENAYRQYMALQIGKPYSFTREEVAACREKLWTEVLFKRTWDHFRAKLA